MPSEKIKDELKNTSFSSMLSILPSLYMYNAHLHPQYLKTRDTSKSKGTYVAPSAPVEPINLGSSALKTVTDFENNIRKGEQILFEGEKSKKVVKGVSDANGKLTVSLDGGDTYLIKIKSVGDAEDYNKIDIPLLEEGYSYSTMQLTIKHKGDSEMKKLKNEMKKATESRTEMEKITKTGKAQLEHFEALSYWNGVIYGLGLAIRNI